MRIWVAQVDDPPTFDPGAAEVVVDEDSGAYSQPWATNVSAGPPNESYQVVHFEVETDLNGVPDLFAVGSGDRRQRGPDLHPEPRYVRTGARHRHGQGRRL